MKIGIAGDKFVRGKPLITNLLIKRGIEAEEIKTKKTFYLPWPKKVAAFSLPDVKTIKDCDFIHAVFPFHTFESIIIAKLLGKKVISHWIGTDVWYISGSIAQNIKKREWSSVVYKLFYKFLHYFIDFHLCGSENLKEELVLLGINAQVIPIIPLDDNYEIKVFSKKTTVYSYMPEERHEFYGSKTLSSLAQEFKDIDFIVTGSIGKPKPANVTCLHYGDDMEKIYDKTTIVFRMPEHDGMALLVLEGLLRGKQVIWNYKFPYCHYARNFKEAKREVKKIISNPKVNYEGAEFVQKHFNSDVVVNKLISFYKEVEK